MAGDPAIQDPLAQQHQQQVLDRGRPVTSLPTDPPGRGPPFTLPEVEQLDQLALELTQSLRAGLPSDRLVRDRLSETFALPTDLDPFDFFAGRLAAHPRLMLARLPALLHQVGDLGASLLEDRRVALMAQEMAAFGAVGRTADLRLDDCGPETRFDFHA